MEKFKFSTMEYLRPDFENLKIRVEELTEQLKNATTYKKAKEVFLTFDEETCKFNDMTTLASIRHTIDTTDKFYDSEVEFIDETYPTVIPTLLAFSDVLYESAFKTNFEEEYGKQLFVQVELQKKSFSEKNIPLMQQEAKLCSEYEKIVASANIEFDGKTHNLFGIMAYFENKDAKVRRDAYTAYSKFYEANEKRFEEIWDELIKIRNEMGRNLGFENYIPLGYMKQGRTDYGAEEVASFREQIKTELVPFCQKLYDAQAKRIGLEKVMAYDEKLIFPTGNATPIGDEDFEMRTAKEVYHDLSKETGEFFDFMEEHELFDLKNKAGKASTGYMTAFNSLKAPFVFSCFNRTTYDMEVLSHELGHAFAGYMAMRSQPISDYYSESTDIAEIHSMSMEQFLYPYAERFFGDDADKFRFAHLQEALTFVPFGVAVDEFQHIMYANPNLTPKERTAEWKKLEEKYMPWRDYGDIDFFAKGGWWYHKIHIFLYPFYYINYTLTTMGAMEFKKKMNENPQKAWEDYMNLCRVGGSKSYLETLGLANLSVPFEDGSVKNALSYAIEILTEKM